LLPPLPLPCPKTFFSPPFFFFRGPEPRRLFPFFWGPPQQRRFRWFFFFFFPAHPRFFGLNILGRFSSSFPPTIPPPLPFRYFPAIAIQFLWRGPLPSSLAPLSFFSLTVRFFFFPFPPLPPLPVLLKARLCSPFYGKPHFFPLVLEPVSFFFFFFF